MKSYSKDERCRLAVDTSRDEESLVDFTVHFGDCGLVHVNVSFAIIISTTRDGTKIRKCINTYFVFLW